MPSERFRWFHCFKKVSVQLLPTDTNWKGGTFGKSLFILELWQITRVSLTYSAFSSYLEQQVSLIGCNRTTLVLICVHWHKSKNETYWKLNFSSKFWICRMRHNTRFYLFFWLRAISCFIFGGKNIVFMESFLFKQLLNLDRLQNIYYLLPDTSQKQLGHLIRSYS